MIIFMLKISSSLFVSYVWSILPNHFCFFWSIRILPYFPHVHQTNHRFCESLSCQSGYLARPSRAQPHYFRFFLENQSTNFSSTSFLHSIPFLLFCRQIPAAAGIVCIRESGDLCDSPTMENGRSVTHTDYHPSDFHFFWIFSSALGRKRIVTRPVFLAWKYIQK